MTMFKTKKTFDSILSNFAKCVDELEELAVTNEAEAQEKVQQATELDKQARALRDEADRSLKAASKIRNLLGLHV